MFKTASKHVVQALNVEQAFVSRTAVARERVAYALRAGLPVPQGLQARYAEVQQLVDTFARAGRDATAVPEARLAELAEGLDAGSAEFVYRVLRDKALAAYRAARKVTNAALPHQPRSGSPSRLGQWLEALDAKALEVVSPLRPGGALRKQVVQDLKHLSATNEPGPLGVSLRWSRKELINASSHGNNTYTLYEKTARTFSRDTVGCVLGHEMAHDRHLDLMGDDAVAHVLRAMAPTSPLLKGEAKAARERVLAKLSVMAEAQADADGVRFAARAGFDPTAFKAFFDHVQARNLPDAHYAKVGYPTPARRARLVERIIAAEDLTRVAAEARAKRP
ncbi:MAG: hypothetical protein VKQ33_13170 [Candidatus Sericytochromatia bacterium]|nr:hypothetical protein [Candidatus Sericytochromatia bacterium]